MQRTMLLYRFVVVVLEAVEASEQHACPPVMETRRSSFIWKTVLADTTQLHHVPQAMSSMHVDAATV